MNMMASLMTFTKDELQKHVDEFESDSSADEKCKFKLNDTYRWLDVPDLFVS